MLKRSCVVFFFFNDTATTEIYTLSLHDALPIFLRNTSHREGRGAIIGLSSDASGMAGASRPASASESNEQGEEAVADIDVERDRKSTRLNSSHANISYAVFCLKKKKKTIS